MSVKVKGNAGTPVEDFKVCIVNGEEVSTLPTGRVKSFAHNPRPNGAYIPLACDNCGLINMAWGNLEWEQGDAKTAWSSHGTGCSDCDDHLEAEVTYHAEPYTLQPIQLTSLQNCSYIDISGIGALTN